MLTNFISFLSFVFIISGYH